MCSGLRGSVHVAEHDAVAAAGGRLVLADAGRRLLALAQHPRLLARQPWCALGAGLLTQGPAQLWRAPGTVVLARSIFTIDLLHAFKPEADRAVAICCRRLYVAVQN